MDAKGCYRTGIYQDMQSLASRTLFYEKMAWNLASGDEAVGESGLLSLVHALKAYLFLDSPMESQHLILDPVTRP